MPIRIDNAENVEIGDNVAIGPFVHMWGGGGIKIGSGTMIGAHTAITSEGHEDNKEAKFGTLVRKPVVIEENVDIGTHCVVLPGVTIGKASVVGAGTVVNVNVRPFSIVVTGRERREWPRRLVGRALQPVDPQRN
jgi:acetyltransferase-like isoleucine patch superfamily enzyme